MLDNLHKKITIHEIFASYFEDKITSQVALAVSRALEEGNICLDIDRYNEDAEIKISPGDIRNSPFIAFDENEIQPFVFKNNKIYLHRYFRYETVILEQIKKNIEAGAKKPEERKGILEANKELVMRLAEEESNGDGIDWQLVAVLNSYLHNFSIITGGPGTGKTSTIVKLLVLMMRLHPSTRIALAAPTGKAAVRMTESLGKAFDRLKLEDGELKEKISSLQSQTIHRLLGVDFNNPHNFKHNIDNPLPYDMIVVDEASMIGSSLMAKLLSAIRPETKIVLMGDKNQLSPVEAGSIFGDLCKVNPGDNVFSPGQARFFGYMLANTEFERFVTTACNILTDKIVELKKSYRFDPAKGIGKFSRLVLSANDDNIAGQLEGFRDCPQGEQCVRITGDYSLHQAKEILHLFEQYASEDDIEAALEKLNKVRILCAVKEGKYGVRHYNALIEEHLGFNAKKQYGQGFYDKQAIMITYNDYTLGLFNGDTGIIRKDKATGNFYFYYFDEKKQLQKIPAASIGNFETAYAITVHKSQGSEYENVLLVMPEDPGIKILTRELVYTAVTRASHNVVIMSSGTTLISSIMRQMERISGIKERIIETDCGSLN